MFEELIDTIAERVPGKADGDYIGPDGLLYCGKCHTPKQCHVLLLGSDRAMPVLCRCGRERVERENAEFQRQRQEELVRALRKEAFPDPALAGCRFEGDDRKNPKVSDAMERYAERWEEMNRENIGLLLYGPVGTGKTFYAACIANALIDRGVPVLMTSFSRIVNTMQGMYEGRQQYLDRVAAYPLLILDDLGAERDSDYMQEQVYGVVDARYRTGRPLIVTTNVDLEEIKNPRNIQYRRIYDRILERCHPVEVPGGSRRRESVRNEYRRRNALLGL